ncbi:16S rRNA (cytosine(967)-C(5))-methyltransferase RsmB [Candidatus Kinetoplastidibacterium crithidiae]|uniref:Ribosomal RNA small subunit methyltransferase B n=1 Tax=Candidatus Kinetoplastidibacterium crithidiae TCC036E TaxID=1208918 RepID=M1LQP5_9PROT|nr:16S rRNA (cytosine(967)-C(5))-methyltransferase RsmB [Candidatus Kinetoplastibacterium crithidii]AFZ82920.1 16S rRNA (cytosine967-C5)-methyltransferase [Candidatus Kinetoplastibacterium crithidii (ex Angomonas deanei ATCC 30255)]AGF47922.1 ribosomal RNA small subunit methyltransferase B [Candidatus Kinetoplastibacterium crithidii TCC036E]
MEPIYKFHFKRDTLSSQMYISSCALDEVLNGRSINFFLDSLDHAIRPSVQSLTFHALRHLGWADFVGNHLVKSYPNSLFRSLFLLSLTLLKFSSTCSKNLDLQVPVYTDFTIVNESVKVANSISFLRPYKGLLNASLRSFLRDASGISMLAKKSSKATWNYQEWWIEKIKTNYPTRWTEILSCADIQAPLTLRVNIKNSNRDNVLNLFNDNGVEAKAFSSSGIVLGRSYSIKDLPGFQQGMWSVQDPGAQLAAPLLCVKDGMKVLDACAAPGGKTSHLLELAEIDLMALDSNKSRLGRLQENLDRLNLYSKNIKIIEGDAKQIGQWWDGKLFDIILADVPCTSSGIVRKHPDIRWIKKNDDIETVRLIQSGIMDSLWKTLVPGGRFLYSTCSIFPEECIYQILLFLEKHNDALLLDSPGQILPTISNVLTVGHDGFFFALLTKAKI